MICIKINESPPCTIKFYFLLFSNKDMKNAVLRSVMILNRVFGIVLVIPLRHILSTVFAGAVGLFLIS